MIRGDGMIFHKTYTGSDGRVRPIHRFRLALTDCRGLEPHSRRTSRWKASTPSLRPYTRGDGEAPLDDRPFTQRGRSRSRLIERSDRVAARSHRRRLARRVPRGCLRCRGQLFARRFCASPTRIQRSSPQIRQCHGRAGRDHTCHEPPGANGVSIRPRDRRSAHAGTLLPLDRPAITPEARHSRVGRSSRDADLDESVGIEDLGVEIDMIDIHDRHRRLHRQRRHQPQLLRPQDPRVPRPRRGKDFDTQIVVKVNVAEVLAKELARPSWGRHPVALGTNTDPYQRAEGRYRLMPGIIAALAASGTPFSILTKGTLLRRDLPLLQAAAERVPGRCRDDDRRLRRRAARVGRAGRPDHRGAARDRRGGQGGRAERLGVPDAGAAVPHRLGRAPRAGVRRDPGCRGRLGRVLRPASAAGRARVVLGLAGARASRPGPALSRGLRHGQLRRQALPRLARGADAAARCADTGSSGRRGSTRRRASRGRGRDPGCDARRGAGAALACSASARPGRASSPPSCPPMRPPESSPRSSEQRRARTLPICPPVH